MAIGRVREADPRSSADAVPGEPVDVTLITADAPLLGSVSKLLSGNRYRLSGRRQPQSLFGLLSEGRTDAVLLDLKLPIVQHLKWASLDGLNRKRAVPLVGVCGVETERTTRLAALEDGLWDVVELPLEAAELIAKLDNWVWLKKDVDGLRAGVLLDVETGHYSSQGMKRRLREVSALAQRTGQALSCVLFGADPLPSGQDLRTDTLVDAGREFSLALHHGTRNSLYLAIALHSSGECLSGHLQRRHCWHRWKERAGPGLSRTAVRGGQSRIESGAGSGRGASRCRLGERLTQAM